MIDLGLRLADVKELNLLSEEQVHFQQKDPTEKFRDWYDDPVSDDEADFLKGQFNPHLGKNGGWRGQRVELNAMTSPQYVTWLERKLDEVGVPKLVPNKKTLAAAWNRAKIIVKARRLILDLEASNAERPPFD